MASLFLTLAVITTGLYAGFLLTFLIAVVPGLAALPDDGFTAAMRRFNEKVPGPVFLVVFLGVIAFPAVALVAGRDAWGWPPVAAALVCTVGSHLVTIAGNIPLNKALAASESPAEARTAGTAGEGGDSAARTAFEARWNIFHQIRTALSLTAFVLLTVAAN
ncbi:putative membrane protein [Streptomyces sp. CEV 2-1]|uniref:anthrone oxygenase family protein n=1 Tax=Streptomyces sp. CEV 2-1 TaxID=2485153 RepID=UPI000F475F29|nr:anthrone oxygenase family protein [Streptomyces sp. CEV 2-1]ROQ71495.1 putative membrane protein [Streptomyces sp. CEV 2-1]